MRISMIGLLSGAALTVAASQPAPARDGPAGACAHPAAAAVAHGRPIVHRYEYHHAPRHHDDPGHARPPRRQDLDPAWDHGGNELRSRHHGYYERHRRGWPYYGSSSLFFLYRY